MESVASSFKTKDRAVVFRHALFPAIIQALRGAVSPPSLPLRSFAAIAAILSHSNTP